MSIKDVTFDDLEEILLDGSELDPEGEEIPEDVFELIEEVEYWQNIFTGKRQRTRTI